VIIRLATLTLLLASTTACGSEPLSPAKADPRLRTSFIPGADWLLVKRPGFSFLLPPGYEKLPLQPIDSDAATFASGASSLHYDYGWYTGAWTEDGQPDGTPIEDLVRQRVSVGGRVAEVVSFRYADTYVVRAWWRQVGQSHGQDEHLLVRIESNDPHEREVLLASLYSVEFD
jgi:hypothetical protein